MRAYRDQGQWYFTVAKDMRGHRLVHDLFGSKGRILDAGNELDFGHH